MFIYTYTEAEGTESRRIAAEIDLVMKPAFGDRPTANGHQNTGPRLSARMLQEYMAAQRELVDGIVTDDMVQLFDNGNYGVGMNVVSPCGLTLCHAVNGSNVGASIDIENLHYHQRWSGPPMEVIDRARIAETARLFLEHAPEWKEQLAAAFKADSKGVKMRNMALNNMDAYLERYFDGTGITYCCDKRHADGHKSHLLVRLNAYKTLDLPIPHDDFINHLDLVKPHMVEFAYMARDGRFTVRSEVLRTGRWCSPAAACWRTMHRQPSSSNTASGAGCTASLTAAPRKSPRWPNHRCSKRSTASCRARNCSTTSPRTRRPDNATCTSA